MKITNCSDLTSFLVNQAFTTESSYSYKDNLKSLVLRILGAFGSNWAERKLSILQTAHRVTPFYSRLPAQKERWLLGEGKPVLEFVLSEYKKRGGPSITPKNAANFLSFSDAIWSSENDKFWNTCGFDYQLAIEMLIQDPPVPAAEPDLRPTQVTIGEFPPAREFDEVLLKPWGSGKSRLEMTDEDRLQESIHYAELNRELAKKMENVPNRDPALNPLKLPDVEPISPTAKKRADAFVQLSRALDIDHFVTRFHLGPPQQNRATNIPG